LLKFHGAPDDGNIMVFFSENHLKFRVQSCLFAYLVCGNPVELPVYFAMYAIFSRSFAINGVPEQSHR